MVAVAGMQAISGGMLRTRGAEVDIAFTVRGDGPAVVLLHGTSANHAVWEPVAEALAASATVISLDQRGHGRSAKPAASYDGPDFADDVITVLDALGIGRAVVAGHSLGGRNAWLVGARHPDRVDAVMAMDYTPYVATAVLDELAVRVAAGYRGFADVPAIEQYLHERYPRIPPAAVARRVRGGYARAADGQWWPLADPAAMRQLIEGFRTPWDAEFRAVRTRMTHLRGLDSRIVDARAWDDAARDRPHDRWVVLDGADHYIPEELPSVVADELRLLLTT